MNKSGLIEALSKKLNLTEKKAIDVVNLVFKGFTDELKKADVSKSGDSEALSLKNMVPIQEEIPKPAQKLKLSLKSCPSSK